MPASAGARPLRTLLLAFLAAAAVTGGVLSWFASKDPDGLEWSIARVTGADALPAPEQGVHAALAALQERIAVLPDYAFRKSAEAASGATGDAVGDDQESRLGSSVSGIVGGSVALVLAFLIRFLVKWRVRAASGGGGSRR